METITLLLFFAILFGGPALWGIVDSYLKHRRKMMELQLKMVAEKAAVQGAQNERLEQRLRVLERIVTDKGLALSDEIEKLRDRPLN